MLKKALVTIVLVLLPGLAFAEAIPRGGPNDNRVRLATYQEGQVYRLNVSLTHVTTIEFGEGESIRAIIAGDTEGFEIDGVPGGQAFAIKPVARGVHTNVTVYTNRRSYYFNVEEASNPTFYVVQFRYPEDEHRPRNAIAQAAPNYNYAASERLEFTPLRVWDDGTFTYFQFERNAPVPAHVHNGWDRSTDLGPDGRGLDSLALLEVVARVNQIFALHTTGVEDYMFVRPTLGDWTDLL